MPTTTNYTGCTDCCPADTVETDCCAEATPTTLNGTATLTGGTGSPCNCATTANATATYNSGTGEWSADFTFGTCNETLHIEFSCVGTTWTSTWTVCGITNGASDASGTPVCDPFEVTFPFDSADSCACGAALLGSVTFTA
jgi:hypothetical protein